MRNRAEDFNFSDFKKWMNHQQDGKSKLNMIGFQVESKISLKKLLSRIEPKNGELEELAEDFKKNGGIINETNENKFLIEVESGTFIIHKMYIRKN